MNKVRQNNSLLKLPILAMAICIAPLMAQDGRHALLVQKSPEYGGNVTPAAGLQMVSGSQIVTITATARDGYEFVYWLGDVTNPTSSITTILVDGPKMVIAVFQRPELENYSSDAAPGGVSGGGQSSAGGVSAGGIPSPRGVSSGSGSIPRPSQPPIIYVINPDDTDDPEVPEPATILLVGSGAMMLVRRRNRKRRQLSADS